MDETTTNGDGQKSRKVDVGQVAGEGECVDMDKKEIGQTVEENHVSTAFRLIGTWLWLWPVVLVITTTLLYGFWQVLIGTNDFIQADIVFCVAVLYLLAKTEHWVWSKSLPKKQSRVISIALASIVLFLCGGEIWWVKVKSHKSENISVSIIMKTTNISSGSSIVWVEYHGPRGTFITPASIVLQLVISNKSKDALWLKTVEVDYRSSVWPFWKPIDTLNDGTLYFVESKNGLDGQYLLDLSKGHMLSFTTKSIGQISAASLAPETAFPAYALFEYPANFSAVGKSFRLKVCDSDEDCSFTYFTVGKLGEDENPHSIDAGSMTWVIQTAQIDLRDRLIGGPRGN